MIRAFLQHQPQVHSSCYIDQSAHVLGQVEIGERSSVWMNAVLRGDVSTIRIGRESNVQDCAVLHGQRGQFAVEIGDRVSIGHNAAVHGCVVEDEVLVGIGAIILNGAHIGRGSIIAAGALVPEGVVIPPRSLVMGTPGRVKREVTDTEYQRILSTAANYLYLQDAYKGND